MAHAQLKLVHASLWRDVLDTWFPACVRPGWGFHQNFDRRWNATGGADRFIVFQARMTWLCATIASAGNTEPFADYARHGVAMLAKMRHGASGAYHWDVDADGEPGNDFRHARAYGQAFAIFGLSAAARALEDEAALEAAKHVFHYLELYHRDRSHDGYFELTQFAGPPVLQTRDQRPHPIGGIKTLNTHLHLFEAYVTLYGLWPDPMLRQRLEDMIRLFTVDWWTAPGHVAGEVALDGRPVPDTSSCGHGLEVAHLLLEAAAALGRPADPDLCAKATALIDTALDGSWGSEGGFLDPRAILPSSAEPLRTWWVQAEGLASLAALYAATADPAHLAAIEKQWAWIQTRQIDAEHGGWFERVGADGQAVGDDAKGKWWKDPYHEVRAMLLLGKALGASEKALAVRPVP